MKSRPLIIVGITGGIGSGKSFVTGIFRQLGAELIDADKLCHALLNKKSVCKQVTDIWPTVMDHNNEKVDRKKLGRIVFEKKEEIEQLNKILHPIVLRQIKKILAGIRRKKREVAVIDAALLEESNLSHICSAVVFVETEIERRERRCKESRNWEKEEISRREIFQLPLEIKKKRATFIINNNNSEKETIKQAKKVWDDFNNISQTDKG